MDERERQAELRRLVTQVVCEICGIARRGLWFCVDHVEEVGKPTERLRVWATLHFLVGGSPYCCGEPGCHLGLFGERLVQVTKRLKRELNVRQHLVVEFVDDIRVHYHPGVKFQRGGAALPEGAERHEEGP